MNKFRTTLAVILIFILQWSVLGLFFSYGRTPNIFLAYTAAMAIMFGFEKSLGTVIFAGILLDISGGYALGSGTLALVIILWAVDRLKRFAELRSRRYLFVLLLCVITATALVSFDLILSRIIMMAGYLAGRNLSDYTFRLDANYAWKIAYTVIAGLMIYLVLRRFRKNAPVRI